MSFTRHAACGLLLVTTIVACTSGTPRRSGLTPRNGAQQPATAGDDGQTPPPSDFDPGESSNEAALEESLEVGIPKDEAEQGRLYVNGWTGRDDEAALGGKWTVKTQTTPAVPANPSNPANPTNPTNPTNPANPTNPTVPDTTPDTNNGDGSVSFRIKAGTGKGAWNDAATEVVLKVGKPFTIYNDDTITHQWHTNGSPCQHGNPIAPGKSETCTPNQKFNAGPLYDHITEGKFHVRAE